ncbi:MAG TPA: hypothetical protein VNY05_45590 [Candidatus Acidoferrales bacterium]|nr:hypothetical protein [Candidatus Acidoferrales bacterium]
MILLAPDMVDGDIEVTRQQNRNYCLTEGFHSIAKKSNAIGLFLRYQAQFERLYRCAVEEFDRLKALRHELPHEPISDPQPEPTEPTCPPSQPNPIPLEPVGPAPSPATGHRHPATGIQPPASGHRHPATGHAIPRPFAELY